MWTNPTQNPTQTRRNKMCAGPGELSVPVAPAHGSATVADPRTGAAETGLLSSPGDPSQSKIGWKIPVHLWRVGETKKLRGNTFHCVEHRPHTNRLGFAAIILVLATKCEVCAQPFQTTVGLNKNTAERQWAYPTKRCAEHRAANNQRGARA